MTMMSRHGLLMGVPCHNRTEVSNESVTAAIPESFCFLTEEVEGAEGAGGTEEAEGTQGADGSEGAEGDEEEQVAQEPEEVQVAQGTEEAASAEGDGGMSSTTLVVIIVFSVLGGIAVFTCLGFACAHLIQGGFCNVNNDQRRQQRNRVENCDVQENRR